MPNYTFDEAITNRDIAPPREQETKTYVINANGEIAMKEASSAAEYGGTQWFAESQNIKTGREMLNISGELISSNNIDLTYRSTIRNNSVLENYNS